MAGKIVADQIEHSTAGSVSTQYVIEGSAKAWINFQGDSTASDTADYTRDSLNLSVTLDNGTGNYTLGFTSNMGNANYCAVSSGHSTNIVERNSQHTHVVAFTTSNFIILCNNSSSLARDWALSTATVHGDLA